MTQDGYFREKLSAGVSCLVGLGDIRQRIANAFFAMPTVTEQGFSDPELGRRYAEVYNRVTAKDATGDEGKINATLKDMSDDEASEIAHEIFEIHAALQFAAETM